jgi:hypothetical protein
MGLTNFPNGITSFGVPIFGNLVPATFGDVYFVDYRNGADDNDGKSRDCALKTLSRAYALCTSNNNDVVLIDGDSEVVETSMITLSKNRICTIGLNGWLPPFGYGAGARVSIGVTTDTDDIALLQNTGVRNSFIGIKFSSSNTLAQATTTVMEAGEYSRYYNCEFYKSDKLTTAAVCEVHCNGDSAQFANCTFGDLVNSRGGSSAPRPCVNVTREKVSGKVARDCTFVNCHFLQKAAHADANYIYGSGVTDVERRMLLIDCVFWNCTLSAATIADGITFGGAQTQGDVLLINPAAIKTTAFAEASQNVFVQGAVPTHNTTGIAVEVAA